MFYHVRISLKKKKERIFWTSKVFRNLSLHKNHGIFLWAQNFFSFKIKTHKCFLEIFSTYTILFSFSSNLFFFSQISSHLSKNPFSKKWKLVLPLQLCLFKRDFSFFLKCWKYFHKASYEILQKYVFPNFLFKNKSGLYVVKLIIHCNLKLFLRMIL